LFQVTKQTFSPIYMAMWEANNHVYVRISSLLLFLFPFILSLV
jgi:hypothetical protein